MTEIIVIVLIIIISIIVIYPIVRKIETEDNLKEAISKRTSLSRSEYIEIFEKKGFDKNHIEIVYDEIKDYLADESISMYPEDGLHKLYGMTDLDDVEIIDKIFKKANVRLISKNEINIINEMFNYLSAEYILTALQMVTNNDYNEKQKPVANTTYENNEQ